MTQSKTHSLNFFSNSLTLYAPTDGNAWSQFTCGHCDSNVSGFTLIQEGSNRNKRSAWLICPQCKQGTVRLSNQGRYVYFPSPSQGFSLEGLPEKIESAYSEARTCISNGALNACELVCRNILMYVAVDKGANKGRRFVEYIKYLEDKGYVTPPMKPWVDLIRKHGNKAAHEIEEPNPTRVEGTFMFTAELLRLVYEMEFMTKRYTSGPKSDNSVQAPGVPPLPSKP